MRVLVTGVKGQLGYDVMNELKKQGIAVMFVSSEMPEVMGIADRIIVMCEGKVTGDIDISEATQERIMDKATRNID